MQILDDQVSLATLHGHDERTKANVRLDRYHIDDHCPIGEFRIRRIRLDSEDRSRLYLLGLTEFGRWTNGGTFRLSDINEKADADKRTAAFIDVDLRLAENLEPVIVTVDIGAGPLVIIDGNHRAAAQQRRFGSMVGVAAYVCEHPRINRWGFVPPLAR